jgi:protein SPT2
VLKRKAEGESTSNGMPSKIVKQSHSASRNPASKPSPPPPIRPNALAKPTAASTNGVRTASNTPAVSSRDKPYTGTSSQGRVNRKPETITISSSKKDVTALSARPAASSATLSAPKVLPAKPSPTTPTSAGPTKAPKKGSFAEIMARGAKAQQIAPKAGLIQHKAITQTVMSKKERDQQKSKWKLGKAGIEGKSSVIPSREKPGPSIRNGGSKDPRSTVRGNSRSGSAGEEVADKKIKKAAMASTGYTGTARPPPKKALDPSNVKSTSSRGRPAGGLLAPPRTGRHQRDDDEDSDMDDFIDDDEDEDDMAPSGYRYANEYDSDSDMEAGADDIYAEEQRALRQAREDDAKEEALLDKLRREKEARKRRAGY